MHQRLNRTQSGCLRRILSFPSSTSFLCACLIASACVLGVNGYGQTQTQPQPSPRATLISPEANHPPDANTIMEMREQQTKKKNFDAANAERKRQINEDSVLLLKLANELKLETEKTSEDELSVSDLRKIEDIERLAHSVQQKMKLTIGAN